ncbi:MAG TPA: MFS transporter [Trebonia sp.]
MTPTQAGSPPGSTAGLDLTAALPVGGGGPRAGRRTTVALVSLALGGVAFGTAEFASIGVLPSVASSLSVSQPRAGLASTLTDVSGIPRGWIPAVLSLFGVGMTAGTVLGGRLADRSVLGTMTLGLVAIAVVMAGFTELVHHRASAVLGVFLLGMACMTVMPSVQGRLLDVAPDAPTLAASIMHSATNSANAIGAWAGGLVLSAGAGYAAIGRVGAAMAAGGVILACISAGLARKSSVRQTPRSTEEEQ